MWSGLVTQFNEKKSSTKQLDCVIIGNILFDYFVFNDEVENQHRGGIKYEDKKITCDYFDVDMETNIAIAYNNVVVTDPQSIMKAGKIILNIETKVININPGNEKKKVSLTIN